MSNYEEVEELRNKRLACSCGHRLFMIIPKENGELDAHCFMCGKENM
jgi:hypothetical protein